MFASRCVVHKTPMEIYQFFGAVDTGTNSHPMEITIDLLLHLTEQGWQFQAQPWQLISNTVTSATHSVTPFKVTRWLDDEP